MIAKIDTFVLMTQPTYYFTNDIHDEKVIEKLIAKG